MQWLGKQNDKWNHEVFPEGCLNKRQVDSLFSIDDPRYGRFNGLRAGIPQPILKLTDHGFLEVHGNIGTHNLRVWDRQAVIWMNNSGEQLATAIQLGQQNASTQMFDNAVVEAYLWDVEKRHQRWGKEPETRQYDRFWSLGDQGAVPQIRQFIKETFVNVHA